MQMFHFGEEVDGYEVKVLNEREVRAGAGILFLFAFISFVNCVVTQNIMMTKIFIWAFLIEFIIRVFINYKYAPSLALGRFIIKNQIPEYVGAIQKRFAWSIGLGLATLLFVLTTIFPPNIGEENLHSVIVGLSCITCLILLYFEAVFGICIGCTLYNKFHKNQAQYCAGGICKEQEIPRSNKKIKTEKDNNV